MARKSCGQDEDLQRAVRPIPASVNNAPDDQRMYDEFADHDNDHVERDLLKSSGKRYRKVGAYDEKGELRTQISPRYVTAVSITIGEVETGLSKEASDEDADESEG